MNIGNSTIDTQTYVQSSNQDIADELKNIENFASNREIDIKKQKLHGPVNVTTTETLEEYKRSKNTISGITSEDGKYER